MSKRALLILLCWLTSITLAFGQEGASSEKRPAEAVQDENRSQAQKNGIEARLQEAWYLEVASGRYEEALEIYQQLLAEDHLDPVLRARTQLRLGITLRRLGRIEESRAVLQELVVRQRAEQEAPGSSERRVNLLEELKAAERAVEKLEEYLMADHPKRIRAVEQLEELRAKLGDVTPLTEAQLQAIQPIVQAAQEELTGGDAERNKLRQRVESLIVRLGHEDEATRKSAAGALKNIGPEVVPFVLEALQSGDYYVSVNAADVLVYYARSDDEILDVVLTALRSSDKIVQQALTSSLSRGSWPTETMVRMMEDESPDVRAVAVQLTRGLTPEARAETLLERLEDPEPKVRALAVRALMELTDDYEPFSAQLEDLAGDPDASVRLALAETAVRYHEKVDQQQLAGALLELLDDPSPEVVERAVAALQGIATDRDSSVVLTPQQAQRLLDELARLYETSNERSRGSIAYGLALLENDRSRDLLLRALEDPSRDVARAAAYSLSRRLDDRVVVERFVDLLGHPELGSSVGNPLTNALSEEAAAREVLIERLLELPGELMSRVVSAYPERSVEKVHEAIEESAQLSPSLLKDLMVVIYRQKLEQGTPAILQGLRSSDPEVVRAALSAAQALPSREMTDALAELLENYDDTNVIVRALQLASQLGVPELIESVGRWLDSGQSNIQRDAIRALRGIDDRRVLPFALDALSASDNTVSEIAARIVQRHHLGPEDFEALLERLPRIDDGAWRTISEVIRERATPRDAVRVAESLDEAPQWLQVGMLRLLASLEEPAVLPIVRPYAESADTAVRQWAQNVLLKIGEFEDLVALLDTRLYAKNNAIQALGRSDDPRAFDALLQVLREAPVGRNQALTAIQALEPFARPEAIPLLVSNAISAEPAKVHHQEKVGDRVVREWDEYVAVTTLASYPAELALDALAEILRKTDNPAVRKEALETLTRFSEPQARELIIEQIDSDVPSVRAAATEALGTFLDEDLLPRLVELLRHRLPEVREAAQRSIEKIRFYLDQKQFAERVVKGGEPSGELEELVNMLESPEASVRKAAAEALGRIGDRSALPALLKARKDSDEGVRRAVEAAIDSIVE